MGVGLVKAAYARWGDLPGGPFRLLVWMALRAKDADDPPLYWAGREDLAFGLGRVCPPPTDSFAQVEREVHFKAVKCALRVLTKRGAIKTQERARPGRTAVYMLNVTREWGTKTVPQVGDENRTPVGDENRPEWGTVFVRNGGRKSSPQGKKEEEGGLRSGVDGEGDLPPAPVAHGRASGTTSSIITADCETCGTELDRDGSCFICRTPAQRRARA